MSQKYLDNTLRGRTVYRDINSRRASRSVGRNLIVEIGIDRYQRWPQLANAVYDALGVSEILLQRGFERLGAPLLDERATGRAIHELVADDLVNLSPHDSLVLFFAGHGGTRRHRVGDRVLRTGYLIPVDAGRKVATWIDLEGWLRAISLLPPRHILVVLDACYSGIALDPVARWCGTEQSRSSAGDGLATRQSRRIITSALDDQRAADTGPVPNHSLFAGCLMEGLSHDAWSADRRVISGTELGLYVQRRVSTYPSSRQTPDVGSFGLDERGEMFLPLAPVPGRRGRARPAGVGRTG